MLKAPYRLERPKKHATSVIFASPHSGRDYPWAFLRDSVLDSVAIRTSEDAFVDVLFEAAPRCGAPLLCATAPRAFIDLNRGAGELDPAVIEGIRKSSHNPRVASGLGVIPRVVASGRAIYRGKLGLTDAQARIDRNWRPYHAALRRLVSESLRSFGEAILIDCHSMPHEAVERISPGGRGCPDVVLGDRFGASAAADVVDRIEGVFRAAGLGVVRNAPFAGAYVTKQYGRPATHQHAVQVEIDRSLYMDEQAVRPNGNFETFRALMSQVTQGLADVGRQRLPLAAE